MVNADRFEFPQGDPLFLVSWRTVSDGLLGTGVLSNGDLEITTTNTALEIEVSSGTVWYGLQEYSYGGGTFTLSSGGTADRWDLVYYDTGNSTVAVREGTEEQYPTPPQISDGEVILGYVYVQETASDISTAEVKNWRARARDAAQTRFGGDVDGHYTQSNVEGALIADLIEAAQLTSYPLSLGTDTDRDLDGTDLDDTAGPGTLYDSSTGVIVQSVLGGPASDLTTYPLSLGTDTDRDLDGSNLLDAGTTVYDSTADEVPRPQVDDQKQTRTVTSTTATTADEEVIFVDTAGMLSSSTITLASADATSGNTIVVTDSTGSASDYPIVVETEGGETIHGQTTKEIDTAGGALVFTSDGSNWSLGGGGAGGGTKPTNVFEGREGGSVADGDDGLLVVDSLADGETVEVYKATLVNQNVAAVPTDVDLELVTFDNSGGKTVQTTLLSGDGSTVYDASTGQPLGSYSNASGAESSIGVVVSNASGSSVDIFASAEGERNV
jgi:hypothetical protein